MSQKYLRELVEFAQKTIPELEYSFRNASTHYALQDACQKQFNVISYMLHHIIYAAYENGVLPAAPVNPPAPPPMLVAAPPPPPAFATPIGAPALPPPAIISQPALASPTSLDGAPVVDVQPGITNVIITPQGTRVVAPSGAATVLPPGEHVDLAAASGIPVLPDAPPGVAQVVLPPGGGISPDVLAALASRSG